MRLLQAVKVPAGRQKLVRATIRAKHTEDHWSLPHQLSVIGDLQMVEMGDDKFLTLLLQNCGIEKQYQKDGLQLGGGLSCYRADRGRPRLEKAARTRIRTRGVETAVHSRRLTSRENRQPGADH